MLKQRTLLLIAILFIICGFTFKPDTITIWMMGDSTMSIKKKEAYPEAGWGMPFANYWDSTIEVKNTAQNGRSTKSFIAESRWKPIETGMKKGDYLFIQFGHNDEVPTKKSYTSPAEFTANLTVFVKAAKEKGATPVLITPVARRKFDSTGVLQNTHEQYSQLVREVAAANKVILIDLDAKSQALYKQLGPENSKHLLLHLAPGQNPNHPAGKEDDTHFNEYGARRMAEIVINDIKQQLPELAKKLLYKK
ncbi:rhamnogalacturonan acetylesterase [Terrimonas rubra]|uniref:Rhamnogalacturonan acetylesterase n=1 Tax=Terrimonas rubra TaxID=1035890 RepID=A0ABW6A1H4_9BACT